MKTKNILHPIDVPINEAELLALPADYTGSDQEPQPSGAYIFRPAVQEKRFHEITKVTQHKGELVEELWVECQFDWTSFIQRKYTLEPHYEVTACSVLLKML